MIALGNQFQRAVRNEREDAFTIYLLEFQGSPSAAEGTLYSPVSFPPEYRAVDAILPELTFLGLVSETIDDFYRYMLAHGQLDKGTRERIQAFRDNNVGLRYPQAVSGDTEYTITKYDTIDL